MKIILVKTNEDFPQISKTKFRILINQIMFINPIILNHIQEMNRHDNQDKLSIQEKTQLQTTPKTTFNHNIQ